MKLKIILILSSVVLIASLFWRIEALSTKLTRSQNNFAALQEEAFKQNKESQRVYTVTIAELKRDHTAVVEQLREDFDIKLRNVKLISSLNTETKTTIETFIRDTTVTDSVKLRVAHFRDAWTSFDMTVRDNIVSANISTRDSITCVLHKQKRTFGQWIRGDSRKVLNEIKNYNPNSVITYNRVIEIQK